MYKIRSIWFENMSNENKNIKSIFIYKIRSIWFDNMFETEQPYMVIISKPGL